MRDLSDDCKLSVRSIVEVYDVLADLELRVARDRSIRTRKGRRPSRAAIINALVLWLSALPDAEQARIVAEGMTRLNAILAAPAPPGSDCPEPDALEAIRPPSPPAAAGDPPALDPRRLITPPVHATIGAPPGPPPASAARGKSPRRSTG